MIGYWIAGSIGAAIGAVAIAALAARSKLPTVYSCPDCGRRVWRVLL